MNLSQLIATEMAEQRLSYDALAQRAYDRRRGISAQQLWNYVNKPLGGLKRDTHTKVAAALAPSDDLVPTYESAVLTACMKSWGYSIQHIQADHADGSFVVVATSGLTVTQALEVQREAANHIRRLEAATNGATRDQTHPRASAPVFGNGLPNPRGHTDDRDGSSHVTSGTT